MIDTTSPAGSYALAIAHSPNLRVEEYNPHVTWLERRMAARKAARLEPNPHKRGHITRALDRMAQA